MAEDDALFQKGMPIRREVLGPEYVDASMARADEFMMSFQRATTAWAWGWAWGDATLDRKTRSLMNLAMLTALNRAPEIKLHVKGALNNGVTVEEIKAALLHATAYCGIPAGLDASGPRTKCWSARARCRNREYRPGSWGQAEPYDAKISPSGPLTELAIAVRPRVVISFAPAASPLRTRLAARGRRQCGCAPAEPSPRR